MRTTSTRLIYAVITALICAIMAICSQGTLAAYAAQTSGTEFEKTNVLEDLRSSQVNGRDFNILDYPYDSTGELRHPEILTVVEYCYSIRPAQRGNYGVYIYFYNPQGHNLSTATGTNKVTLGVDYGKDSDGNVKVTDYEKFELKFCSKSTGDYQNLFYKFKIIDHKSADGKTVAERVNSNARRYDISEIELLTAGETNATAYTVGGSYIFTGYAKGYGADQNAESTLTCERTDLETVTLDLAGVTDGVDKRTYWRSNSSSAGKYHQNQINSVFFAIDTDVLERYGYALQRIKAEWWEYKTVPAVIIGDKTIYDKLSMLSGTIIENKNEKYWCSNSYYPYTLSAMYNYEVTDSYSENQYSYTWNYGIGQFSTGGLFSKTIYNSTRYNDTLLPMLFYTYGIPTDNYTLSAETLREYCEQYNKSYYKGHIKFNAHDYSADLFMDSVDNGRTRGYNLREFDITDPEDLWQINGYDSNHSWWDKLRDFGFWQPSTDDDYADVMPIQMLENKDFGVTDISDHLKVDPNDVERLTDFYNESVKDKNNDGKPDKAVFLFRYALTDYFAQDLSVGNTSGAEVSGDAEIRQGTQFFDFDILTLTFNKEGDLTTLACVSSPIDHWTDYTPSIEGVEPGWLKWFELGVILLIIVVVIILLIKFAPNVLIQIMQALLWLITAPFRLIGALFKSAKESADRRRAEKQAKAAKKPAKAEKHKDKKPPKVKSAKTKRPKQSKRKTGKQKT